MKVLYLGADEGYEAVAASMPSAVDVTHIDATPTAVKQVIGDADAIIDASMRVRFDEDMLERATKLKIISCATTGSDHIARGGLDARNISVRTLKEDRELLRNITPAAELSWALLMACARKLPAACSHVRNGSWTRELFPGVMLRGKQLGLVGCGRIGGWMTRYATGFGMKVVGFDPYVREYPENCERSSLEDVFRASDFISVHVHLNEETEGMVTRDLFRQVKTGAIFINTSRAAVIDELGLLEVLESGQMGAAGLDVLGGEPDIAGNPLLMYAKTHENLLITPHCGGYSPDAVRIVCRRAAEKVIETLGQSL